MNSTLLARKGEAVPSGLSGSDRHTLAYYAMRRTVTFGQPDTTADFGPAHAVALSAATQRPRPAAGFLMRKHGPRHSRRRFTFRLDAASHDRFCAVARALGCSRQKLLERALERFVDSIDSTARLPTNAVPAVPRLV